MWTYVHVHIMMCSEFVLTFLVVTASVMIRPDTTAMASESLDDASTVRWYHAANSRDELRKALEGDVDFIEADILMGRIHNASESSPVEPIMAHPPQTSSDITFREWVHQIVKTFDAGGKKKGLKLDFKQMEAVEPSLSIIKGVTRGRSPLTIWINADILSGPGEPSATPLQAETFLSAFRRDASPNSTLSVGWTTGYSPQIYHWRHVTRMAKLLQCHIHPETQVTFPVRASLLRGSLDTLTWLLNSRANSGLTIWTSYADIFDAKTLLEFRETIPWSKIYYDLPDQHPQTARFMAEKDNVPFIPRMTGVLKEDWRVLSDVQCNKQPVSADGGLYLPSHSVGLLDLRHLPVSLEFNVVFFSPLGRRTSYATTLLNIWLVEDIDQVFKAEDVEKSRNLLHVRPKARQECFFGKIEIRRSNVIASLWNATCDAKGLASRKQAKQYVQTQNFELDRSVSNVHIGFGLYGDMEAMIINVDSNGARRLRSSATAFWHSPTFLVSSIFAFFVIISAFFRS